MSVFLVEDDQIVARHISVGLRRAGLKVEMARTFRSACRCIRRWKEPPTCALIDEGLPDGRGVDLVPLIREVAPEIAIALISGDVTVDLAMAAHRIGVPAVPRPPRIEDFLNLVDHLGLTPAPMEATRLTRPPGSGVRSARPDEPRPGPFRLTEMSLVTPRATLDLYAGERELLAALASNRGAYVRPFALADQMWGRSDISARVLVYQYATRLRAQLVGTDAEGMLESLRGRGYRLASWAVESLEVEDVEQ